MSLPTSISSADPVSIVSSSLVFPSDTAFNGSSTPRSPSSSDCCISPSSPKNAPQKFPPSDKKVEKAESVLLSKVEPITQRFRSVFTLKTLGGPTAVDALMKVLNDDSVLLKHEAVYCLGQMQDARAIPKLISLLEDPKEHVVVRHEAGEALGAIGDHSVKDILTKYKDDPHPEIAETCAIAVDRLEWLANGGKDVPHKYNSVDPAPPLDEVPELGMLRELLLDAEDSMFNRYRAMFTMRNISTTHSLMMIAELLEDESALFRHEAAFVLGQTRYAMTEMFLKAVLRDESEHEMVRHECAESLGSLGSLDSIGILEHYSRDPNPLIAESCEVALDMLAYNQGLKNMYPCPNFNEPNVPPLNLSSPSEPLTIADVFTARDYLHLSDHSKRLAAEMSKKRFGYDLSASAVASVSSSSSSSENE